MNHNVRYRIIKVIPYNESSKNIRIVFKFNTRPDKFIAVLRREDEKIVGEVYGDFFEKLYYKTEDIKQFKKSSLMRLISIMKKKEEDRIESE